jgi:hypothetical protein
VKLFERVECRVCDALECSGAWGGGGSAGVAQLGSCLLRPNFPAQVPYPHPLLLSLWLLRLNLVAVDPRRCACTPPGDGDE